MKANYLKSLSHVLNHLPKPVLVTELPTVRASLSKGAAAVQAAQQGYSFPVSSPPTAAFPLA